MFGFPLDSVPEVSPPYITSIPELLHSLQIAGLLAISIFSGVWYVRGAGEEFNFAACSRKEHLFCAPILNTKPIIIAKQLSCQIFFPVCLINERNRNAVGNSKNQ